MAQDPWDWTKQIQANQLVAPLAAMPQAQSSPAPSPMNTTGPLGQMAQQKLFNVGVEKAFPSTKAPTQLAPVVDAAPATPGTGPQTGEFASPLADKGAVEVGGPMSGDGASLIETSIEPMAPLADATALGSEIATTEAATAAAEPSVIEAMIEGAKMFFAADGTTAVPNKGGK